MLLFGIYMIYYLFKVYGYFKGVGISINVFFFCTYLYLKWVPAVVMIFDMFGIIRRTLWHKITTFISFFNIR